MFENLSGPTILRFINMGTFVSRSVPLPEPLLTGRLLKDGAVVVVGRSGAIYQFSARSYVDCCTIAKSGPQRVWGIGAGPNEMTAVLHSDGAVGSLDIFRAQQLMLRINLTDFSWVRKVVWNPTGTLVALAGDGQMRFADFTRTGFRAQPALHDIDCGLPIAFEPTGLQMACTASASGNIQIHVSQCKCKGALMLAGWR
jgi:hypothetical protein